MGKLISKDFRIATATDLVLGLFGVALLTSVFVSAIPESALSPGAQAANVVRKFMPEGWAFFTRSARESTIRVYRYQGNGSFADDSTVNVVSSDRFSPSRLVRVRSIFLGIVELRINEEEWVVCEGGPVKCAQKIKVAQGTREMKLALHRQAYCGDVLLQKSGPVPWRWRGSYRNVRNSIPV